MVTVIKKNAKKNSVSKLLQEALKTKGINTHKYCGKISLKESPLVIQKNFRDEWK
ncbi:MAG: hypothetical protein L3J06_04850 [Cyclobacteriaceae bacterium]|nr:hypothetical protein [Cyclobacteriaceae bacterium]